ncbi:cobalamin biosynthesis protein CobG [Onishia taeanensis]
MRRPARVRGWCPGAWRPMATGDGLLVRVRPDLGRLTRAQGLALCDAAEAWGSGLIELTRRANLQLRGVSEAGWPALMAELVEQALVSADAEAERTPARLLAPDWRDGDDTHRAGRLLHDACVDNLTAWPMLPDKWGLALDAGPAPVLGEAPADLRLERSRKGGLLVRADGRDLGTPVDDIEAAVTLMTRLARWFLESGGADAGRMHRITTPLPDWAAATTAPAASGSPLRLGAHPFGWVVGLPFGRVPASTLRAALADDQVTGIRVTPWRRLLLEGRRGNINDGQPADGLIQDEDDPRLAMDVCPGAPHCAQASVATLDLARALSERRGDHPAGRVHVSGCAKGCARGAPAEVCLVGRDGRYDLMLGGRADDTPVATGLDASDAIEYLETRDASRL